MVPLILTGHANSIIYLLWTKDVCCHAFTHKHYALLQFLKTHVFAYVSPCAANLLLQSILQYYMSPRETMQVRSTGS